MEKQVSTILFDLGGVLLNLDYNLTINAFKKLGKGNFEKMYSQAKQNSIFDQLETGEISAQEFRDNIRSFLGEEVTDEMMDKAWNAMLLDFPIERIKLLRNLKEKYQIILFSNTNIIHYKKFREIIKNTFGDENLLENIFDKTYYSHVLGKRKPNQDAFKFILEEMSLQPNEVVFVDDSLQHVQGAKEIGIDARHLIGMDIVTLCKEFI